MRTNTFVLLIVASVTASVTAHTRRAAPTESTLDVYGVDGADVGKIQLKPKAGSPSSAVSISKVAATWTLPTTSTNVVAVLYEKDSVGEKCKPTKDPLMSPVGGVGAPSTPWTFLSTKVTNINGKGDFKADLASASLDDGATTIMGGAVVFFLTNDTAALSAASLKDDNKFSPFACGIITDDAKLKEDFKNKTTKPELPEPALSKPALSKPAVPKPALPKSVPPTPKLELSKPELPKPALAEPALPKSVLPKSALPKSMSPSSKPETCTSDKNKCRPALPILMIAVPILVVISILAVIVWKNI